MSVKITREELMELIFHEKYDELSGDQLRIVRVRIPGNEMMLSHVIGVSRPEIYRNLGLHIGVHLGEDHTGETLGLMQFTPWESVVVAADIATKAAQVQVAFMDRFNGSLILTGEREDVKTAVLECRTYFNDTLKYGMCEFTEN